MKVLWITNILFPDICEELGVPIPVVGGWLKSSAVALLKYHPNVELAVASCYNGSKLFKKTIRGITYYCLPSDRDSLRYDTKLENVWREIKNDFNPDVVHIHGTEYTHGLAYLRACGRQNVVISIQGFISGIARYETGGIDLSQRIIHRSLRSWLKPGKSMAKRSFLELEYIQCTQHVIGRTAWDKSHIWSVNSALKYHFCNETLRKPFYSVQWDVSKCIRHRIFLSQAASPIKGLHKVLMALPLILRHYPDTQVYIAGDNFIRINNFKTRIRNSTYANIIRSTIKQYNLANYIHFTGPLDEYEMVKQYEMAHVFVCPSIIENSPNSLGEAQLVGTPCVASFVGGVPNMVEHGVSGMLYRFEEHEMMAKYICNIFADDSLASCLSSNGQIVAHVRHNEKDNSDRTCEIYREIIGC